MKRGRGLIVYPGSQSQFVTVRILNSYFFFFVTIEYCFHDEIMYSLNQSKGFNTIYAPVFNIESIV